MTEAFGNEAMRLGSTSILRIVSSESGQIYPEPNSEGLPCDKWHITGMGSYLPDEFLKRIKENIPKTDVNVYVSSTGYILWPEDFPDNHYTLDEIGRTVCKIDGIRFFQRYASEKLLVSDRRKKYFSPMSPEEKEDILNYLNSL